jgi:hypothetical protein
LDAELARERNSRKQMPIRGYAERCRGATERCTCRSRRVNLAFIGGMPARHACRRTAGEGLLLSSRAKTMPSRGPILSGPFTEPHWSELDRSTCDRQLSKPDKASRTVWSGQRRRCQKSWPAPPHSTLISGEPLPPPMGVDTDGEDGDDEHEHAEPTSPVAPTVPIFQAPAPPPVLAPAEVPPAPPGNEPEREISPRSKSKREATSPKSQAPGAPSQQPEASGSRAPQAPEPPPPPPPWTQTQAWVSGRSESPHAIRASAKRPRRKRPGAGRLVG